MEVKLRRYSLLSHPMYLNILACIIIFLAFIDILIFLGVSKRPSRCNPKSRRL